MITVTEVAKKKFLETIEAEGRQGHGLRVVVNNAGTQQPEFALNFVAPGEVREDDQIEDVGEFKIYMDPQSAKHLEDATIDFIDNLTESGFVVDAPNAGIPKPSGPVAEAVQTVLQEKINPAIAAHGGQVSLVAVKDATGTNPYYQPSK